MSSWMVKGRFLFNRKGPLIDYNDIHNEHVLLATLEKECVFWVLYGWGLDVPKQKD